MKAYQAEIEDDNEEFAHLGQDETNLAFVNGHAADDEQAGEDDEENEPPEMISAVELQEQLRRVARGEEVCNGYRSALNSLFTNIIDRQNYRHQ